MIGRQKRTEFYKKIAALTLLPRIAATRDLIGSSSSLDVLKHKEMFYLDELITIARAYRNAFKINSLEQNFIATR